MKRTFDKVIGSLNTEQRRAVMATEGPVMVVAGPGTGKTHVLTLRIAQIIDQGLANPTNILALTFTEAAAQNMRDRLIKLIGVAAYSVQIQTFHAFCNTIITQNPEYFTFNDKSTVVSDLEQLQLVREILNDDTTLAVIKPLGRFDRNSKAVKTAISEAKREGITPQRYVEMVESQWIDPELDIDSVEKSERETTRKAIKAQAKLKEIARVYEQYESRLSAAGRFDYDDLIMSVIDAFQKNADLLSEYQESLQYILVDEYQDTNTAQNEVVTLLASHWGEQANVFVVGDPHQSIYRFQGASLYNSAEFLQWYPNAQVITLVRGYRCPPEIYALSHESISKTVFLQQAADKLDDKLLAALTTPLQSAQPAASNSVEYVRAETREEQFAGVAQKITQLIADGTSPGEIAVLFKKNADSDAVAPYVSILDIPYSTAADGDALQSPVVLQLLDYLTLVYAAGKGSEPEDLALRVFRYPWLQVDPLLLFKIGRLAGSTQQNVWDVIGKLTEWEQGQSLDEVETAALVQLREQQSVMMRLAALESSNTISDWLRVVVQESGLSSYVFNKDRMAQQTEMLIALQSFMSFVQHSSDTALQPWSLVDLLRAVETMQSQEIKVPLPTEVGNDAVLLSTVHKAKGMEWDHVFVIDLIDKKWGKSSAIPNKLPAPMALVEQLRLGEAAETTEERQQQRDDDDRRLFYVAVTRARKQLHLCSYIADSKLGKVKTHSESMFITEAGLASLQTTAAVRKTLDRSAQEVVMVGSRDIKKEGRLEAYIKSLLENYHLTVTGLNAYLQDPQQFLLGTLLRVPAPKSEKQELGTALHAFLQKWTQEGLKRSDAAVQKELATQVKHAVEERLRHHTMQDGWSTKAEQIALDYMAMTEQEQYNLVLDREYDIGKGGRAAVLDDIMLSGKLDRLDWLSADKTAMVVVDYKTGEPKTKGEIRATADGGRKFMSEREFTLPEEIQGSYYRQLLFYKLLGELDSSIPVPISTGVLDFVEEPRRSGKLRREQFELPQAHVELLKELIRTVMQEIRSLSFLEATLLEETVLLPETSQEE